MKTSKASPVPGFVDVELRVQWLLAKGNSLSRRAAVLDWESFRPLREAVWNKPAKGPGGPRPHDPLTMFKALLVQRFYGLSDEQTKYQINDRLSFQQFIGWTLTDKLPDANTLGQVFGYMSQSMKGFYLRYIGRRRNDAAIGFSNLIYNLARYEQIVRLQLLPLRAT